MGAGIRIGTRQRSIAARRHDALNALVASGALPTYELTQGSHADMYWHQQVLDAGLAELGGDAWPTELTSLSPDAIAEFRDGDGCAVYRLGDALVLAHLHGGWFSMRVAAPTRKSVFGALSAFRASYPAAYLIEASDPRVPITFWSMGQLGPQPRLRRIEASMWEPIRGNYPGAVQAELDELMSWNGAPGRDGQLLIWQGPPGTGKTWALRALASEWASWAEFHYITDPDTFFVDRAAYMVEVLLSESYAVIDRDSGDIVEEAGGEKWRVLILEDTGELLSAGAKEKYGQGLSRLLNVVDGMIGQGLRVLALVTTNDELDSLNAATVRPGRCLSKHEGAFGPTVFGPMSADEAAAWSGDPNADGGSLAELYSRYSGKAADAFADEPEDGRDLMAAATDARAAVAAAAEEVNPLAVDYGQTAWLADEGKVLWVAGDGTSNEEIEEARAAFLAIDGVDDFDHEAEAMPTGWCDAEVVYGGNPFTHGCEQATVESVVAAVLASDPLLAEAVALASAPLEPLTADSGVVELAAALRAATDTNSPQTIATVQALLAASPLHQLLAAHRETIAAATQIADAAGREKRGSREDSLTAFALSALAAARAPQPIHVHVPEQAAPEVHTHVQAAEAPKVEVNLPEQAAPQVTVTLPEQAAPIVNVHAAEPAPAAPIHIDVHVPEQAAPKVEAPQVYVTVEQPKPKAVRVEWDAHGNKVFVPVQEEEAAA